MVNPSGGIAKDLPLDLHPDNLPGPFPDKGIYAPIGVSPEHHRGNLVDQQAVFLFALPQGLFRPLARRDVTHYFDEAIYRTIWPICWNGINPGRKVTTIIPRP